MRPCIHLPVLTSISLSLSPHIKSFFWLYSIFSSHFYEFFLSSLSASSCPLFPHRRRKFPPTQVIQLNTISFDSKSFSTSISFAFSFIFLFFTSCSSYTYLRCLGTPAIPPRPQHPRLTLALINSRAYQDYCTQLMSSPFSYLLII